MNFLITAGNTQVPIDRVRCITNTFTGRTGAAIARSAWQRGHTVTLATSRPETLHEMGMAPGEHFAVLPYQTYDELAQLLESHIRGGTFDVVCHSAAVSDFLTAGAFTRNPSTGAFTAQTAGKIKSTEPELWLRLVRAPKLVDRIRAPWGFTGLLVKFKLEVGLSEAELLAVAEVSRQHSDANVMVANTLEGAAEWAYIGQAADRYERVSRSELPERLVRTLEDLYQERAGNG